VTTILRGSAGDAARARGAENKPTLTKRALKRSTDLKLNMGEDGNIGFYRCQRNDLHLLLKLDGNVSLLDPTG
jgi:hypothetical protein